MQSLFKLPEDLFHNQTDINFYIYTNNSSNRNRIVFSHHVLCFLIKGVKEIHHANFHQTITNSQYFLLPSGRTLMTDKINNNEYKSLLLFFSDNFLSQFCLSNTIDFTNKNMATNIEVFKKDNFIRNYENSLLLLKNEILNSEELKKIKLNEILNYILINSKEKMFSFISNCFRQKDKIVFMQVIEKNKYTNLTIKELSFLCNMSISTFKRNFHEIYATTPKKYFIDHKMLKAKKLLMKGKYISDISEELQYQNLSSFSKEFKKYFGVSPKEFTNNITY
ncbi:AraC family transcriptional regulator [Apibacter sp. HY039]|uniref:helix-turn-helix domain-containing protein n=1 Tax=Apibacter sp. HY039 TaxID=2501476 RepID=UPI000FEB80FF|nr:AraC family transcriptional regulator [Apibacter sp. HY039]